MNKIKLHFRGPYSFFHEENNIFKSEFTGNAGIYLWTIKQKESGHHLIHYIGETTNMGKRQKEHLLHVLGLNYEILDPEKAQNGISDEIWEGLWRIKSNDGPALLLNKYSEITDQVMEYISIINIFFADIDVDKKTRRHIEGCIGWNLRLNHKNFKVLYPDDCHLGTSKNIGIDEIYTTSEEMINGLDLVISGNL